MRRSVRRRTYVSTVLLAGSLAGCLELESAGFQTAEDDAPSGGDDDQDSPGVDEELERLRTALDGADVEILELERVDGVFSLRMQTRGNADEDINRVASAYSSVAVEVDTDLDVVIEDRGLTVETFDIELAWAEDHAEGRITDQEYLLKVRTGEDEGASGI